MRTLGRVIGWNALLTVAALSLLALAGEAWLRTTRPFGLEVSPGVFVPGLGMHFAPSATVRSVNVDFQSESRTNSLGFLDREPPSREAALASCHVVVVGDSFVLARSMAVADKFHVLLERMAARRLPRLDVTTAAYATSGVGQVHQLAFWDKWIRHRPPQLVVLVAVGNDLAENRRRGRTRGSFTVAQKSPGRWVRLAPFYDDPPPAPGGPLYSGVRAVWHRTPPGLRPWVAFWARDEWRKVRPSPGLRPLASEMARPTAFALDQWQDRTTRANASLIVLGSSNLRWELRTPGGVSALDQFERMAKERSIPFIDQLAYAQANWEERADIAQVSNELHWPNDGHWNAVGHRWAAEALADHMAKNAHLCAAQGRCADMDVGPNAGGCDE